MGEVPRFAVGERVEKVVSDYQFSGIVVCVFTKLNGLVRVVVEHEQFHMLHIFCEADLRSSGSWFGPWLGPSPAGEEEGR